MGAHPDWNRLYETASGQQEMFTTKYRLARCERFVPRHASGMTAAKRKVSVSLDASLVRELQRDGEASSKQVNDAIRDALDRRRRQRRLRDLLAELEARHGPVTDKLVAKYTALLE